MRFFFRSYGPLVGLCQPLGVDLDHFGHHGTKLCRLIICNRLWSEIVLKCEHIITVLLSVTWKQTVPIKYLQKKHVSYSRKCDFINRSNTFSQLWDRKRLIVKKKGGRDVPTTNLYHSCFKHIFFLNLHFWLKTRWPKVTLTLNKKQPSRGNSLSIKFIFFFCHFNISVRS